MSRIYIDYQPFNISSSVFVESQRKAFTCVSSELVKMTEDLLKLTDKLNIYSVILDASDYVIEELTKLVKMREKQLGRKYPITIEKI